MNNKISPAGEIARETLRMFPGFPLKTLARFLVAQHGPLFANDIEQARSMLRYYVGEHGTSKKDRVTHAGTLVDVGPRSLPPTKAISRRPYKLHPGLWGVIADMHIPMHDETVVQAAVDFLKGKKIEGLFVNGDLQDCEAVSPWRPMKKRDFVEEAYQTIDFLDWLKQEFPKIPIVWKPGNHEDRLEMYYWAKAPQLAGLPGANLETILCLEARGI
jgi:hypothetical protein